MENPNLREIVEKCIEESDSWNPAKPGPGFMLPILQEGTNI